MVISIENALTCVIRQLLIKTTSTPNYSYLPCWPKTLTLMQLCWIRVDPTQIYLLPMKPQWTHGPTLLLWRSHLHTALRLLKNTQSRQAAHSRHAECDIDPYSNSVGPWVHCLGRDLNSQVLKHRELEIPKC